MGLEVKKTKVDAPVRILVYGDGGVGKSTLGASAPKPIFIAAEDGLINIDARAITPSSFDEVLEAINRVGTLREVGGEDDVETVVIDSLDWLEPLVWAHTCKLGGKKDIEAFGYGKGYTAALDHWRVFLQRLTGLRAKGMNVILVAHAVARTFQNPLGDDFAKWQIKLQEKAAGLIKEWVDIVGFAQKEFATHEQDNKRVKALSTGRRVLCTDGTAAFDAKTRFPMPKAIPLTWDALAKAIRGGDLAAIASLKERLESGIRELADEEVEKKVRAFLKEKGETVPVLTEAVERLEVNISERRKAS